MTFFTSLNLQRHVALLWLSRYANMNVNINTTHSASIWYVLYVGNLRRSIKNGCHQIFIKSLLTFENSASLQVPTILCKYPTSALLLTHVFDVMQVLRAFFKHCCYLLRSFLVRTICATRPDLLFSMFMQKKLKPNTTCNTSSNIAVT